ncbi:hypothetical protein [Tessaracoccus terricola]
MDAITVATFRAGSSGEPAGVIAFGGLLAAVPLWMWGARYAVALGHARSRVFLVTAAASLLLPLVLQVVGALARIAEERIAPGEAYVFNIAVPVPESNGNLLEGIEHLLAIYGLPVLGLVVLACCWWLGGGILGVLTSVVAWVALGLLWMALGWNVLSFSLGVNQTAAGLAGGLAILAACFAAAWPGFRRVDV